MAEGEEQATSAPPDITARGEAGAITVAAAGEATRAAGGEVMAGGSRTTALAWDLAWESVSVTAYTDMAMGMDSLTDITAGMATAITGTTRM